MCPGGEEAVLKTVAPRGVVGSNPMHSAASRSRAVRCYKAREIPLSAYGQKALTWLRDGIGIHTGLRNLRRED